MASLSRSNKRAKNAAGAGPSSAGSASSSSKKKNAQSAAARQMSVEHKQRINKYKSVQGPLHGKDEIRKVHNLALKKEMKLSDKAKMSETTRASRVRSMWLPE